MDKTITIHIITWIIVTVSLISLIPDVYAHELIAVRPDNTMFQTAVHFPNPFTESYFTLEEFEREGQSHWYSFVGVEGEDVFIQTLIPEIPNTQNLQPCFDLLIGEDKVTPKPQMTRFFEEFTKTSWFITCELRMELPSDGLYYIRAHDDLSHYEFGDTGKFSLGFGEAEDFSIFDWMQFPFWSLHMALFFENFVFVWIMLVLLVIIAVIVLVGIKRHRER